MKRLTPALVRDIWKRHRSGSSQVAIASATGVSRTTVQNALRRPCPPEVLAAGRARAAGAEPDRNALAVVRSLCERFDAVSLVELRLLALVEVDGAVQLIAAQWDAHNGWRDEQPSEGTP